MGRLRSRHILEAAFWLAFAGAAYAVSFQFDREMEMYRYGAAGWPRAVILAMALAAVAQLFVHWRSGDGHQDAVVESRRAEDEAEQGRDREYYLRVGGILVAPVVYAYSMDWVGFYLSTPVFAAAVIYLMGERRWQWIAGVSLLQWSIVVLIFTVILYTGLPTGNTWPFYDISNWLLVLLR